MKDLSSRKLSFTRPRGPGNFVPMSLIKIIFSVTPLIMSNMGSVFVSFNFRRRLIFLDNNSQISDTYVFFFN